jgi:hypothetical protein
VRLFKPPHRESFEGTGVKLFLAGSIDQGAARDWQSDLAARLADLDVDIFNPRREQWDPTWEQSLDNPEFVEQVEWELDHLDAADVIALVFDEKGKAPISLLELGLYAATAKIVCFCPNAYWRSGNVGVVCKRYGIPLHEDDFDAFTAEVRFKISRAASRYTEFGPR